MNIKKRICYSVSIFAALLIACSFIIFQTKSHANQRDMVGNEVSAVSTADHEVMRILVLGCDRTANLTDSIFLVSLNKSTKDARVLQIPRDTYANYTDRDYKKLNGALDALGENGIKSFLSEALGVRIDNYVILNLACLKRIVNAIGGVDVNIPQEMHYSDPAQGLEIHLPAGETHLDGERAEQFVRFRSGYANADLGRLDAQKLFLRGFAKRCLQLDAAEIFRILCVILTDLQTDLSLPRAVELVSFLQTCDAEAFPIATMIGQAVQGKSGAWYYCFNRIGAYRMVRDYLQAGDSFSEADFDPNRVFDRPENDAFHKIYTADDGKLPEA